MITPERSENVCLPSIGDVKVAYQRLSSFLRKTPVIKWDSDFFAEHLGANTELFFKCELWQKTGSFKLRGTMNVILNLPEEERGRGFVTVSSGNHAAAVSYCAREYDVPAKIVMSKNTEPHRVAICERYGAEVVLANDVTQAFDVMEQIREQEGLTYIHPWEGVHTTCGTATVGLELLEQVGHLDYVIVAIGGGGLCSGLGTVLKQLQPQCQLLAVEPVGADTMYRSFLSGTTETLKQVNTIAGPLAPPHTEPYSLGVCQATVDQLALIDDASMVNAVKVLSQEMQLMVEPACAAATAGLLGPYKKLVKGKRVAVMLCGSNITIDAFNRILNS